MPNYDITEDFPYDLATPAPSTTFALSDIAYDVTIGEIPFIMSVNNQDPHRRETAEYRKAQFDNSNEPGEQSLSGWWIRSQASYHNGAGIGYYEPGTDQEHTSHRFHDSRGVDVWTAGEASMLKELFHGYTGTSGIIGVETSNGSTDCIVFGDSAGALKKVVLDGNNTMTSTTYTLDTGHSSSYPFKAVTTDGTHYYAACTNAIHKGSVSGTTNDISIALHTGTNNTIRYIRGYLFFSDANGIYWIDDVSTDHNHGSGSTLATTGTTFKKHLNTAWQWNSIAAGRRYVYASGYAGNRSEIWAFTFDPDTAAPDVAGAVVVAEMPVGEIVQCIEYYLGFLLIGTDKGIRIATIADDGSLTYGPLLYESTYPVNGFTTRDRFAYAATKIDGSNNKTNGVLVRIDLSQNFGDGTFAYAYDLEYRSSEDTEDPQSSDCTNVFIVDDRLIMQIEETTSGGQGELQVEHSTNYRTSGWLETGWIRYGTVEPKQFYSINARCSTGTGDTIDIAIIDQSGSSTYVATVTTGLSNIEHQIISPSTKQEKVKFRFTLNNANPLNELPSLHAWQVKAVPSMKRQRLIQYPLSCFDIEMDRYNNQFGYEGRAWEYIQRLETLEENGQFTTIVDYRTGETYKGVIESVSYRNESSSSGPVSGYGGTLIVTVRKL